MSIEQVNEFHKKFGIDELHEESPRIIQNEELIGFRIKFMLEELTEFTNAQKEKDHITAFDSLLDLAYVVYGTALTMGITPEMWNKGFDAVHRCNMQKVRAQSAAESKRDSAFDVVKPEGWVGPEEILKTILGVIE